MNQKITNLPKKVWPQSLKELPKSQLPKKLRVLGNSPTWSNKRICIIGSRKYSDYGLEVCRKIIEGLKNYPITIISGLAYGIDSEAHRLAIENNIETIAIPGSGLDKKFIYPQRHINLSEKIIRSGGCLISEYNDTQPATIWTFPKRNRIMAGMSDLVLIIEAAEKSGTMITARLALDYNIDVACVPGSIFNQTSTGTNKLLKEGAFVVTCAEDILEILKMPIKQNEEVTFSRTKKTLKQKELEIFELLEKPMSKDELVNKTKLKISEINIILSTLEIQGLIHKIDNKICQK